MLPRVKFLCLAENIIGSLAAGTLIKGCNVNSECVGIDDFLVVIYGSVHSAEVSNACRSRPAHVTQLPQ